jgi:hypothetical protein
MPVTPVTGIFCCPSHPEYPDAAGPRRRRLGPSMPSDQPRPDAWARSIALPRCRRSGLIRDPAGGDLSPFTIGTVQEQFVFVHPVNI